MFIRCDNGPEFIAQTLHKFVTDATIKRFTSTPARPGKMATVRASTAVSEMNS